MRQRRQFHIPIFFAAIIFLAARAAAQAPVAIEAVAGEPFGVGRITFQMPPETLPGLLGVEGIGISDRNGRVLYPAINNPAFGKFLKGLLESKTPLTTGGPVRARVGGLLRGILDQPQPTTLFFLFRGTEPLELTLTARSAMPIAVVPRRDPIAHGRLLQAWWAEYAKPAGVLSPKPDYPPMVQNYLTSMLARRLNFRLPDAKQTESPEATMRRELGLNLGTEWLRMAMLQDRVLGLNHLGEKADRPLPPDREPPTLGVPPPPKDVEVEPIAMHVPVECFYVRFGSFDNFLWMQDTLAQWGGDAQNLIALRALDRGMSRRMERQLVLKQTALARMFGSTVIADVAIIGLDMFFREGASYGLLFHARSNMALSSSFSQQRRERIKAGGVTEETVKINGRDVSYLSSPDGTVRSYYVADGDFHLMATSRHLVERFLAASRGRGALGASPEFRHARTIMPLKRDDTIWLYLSAAFFHNMTGPKYRIEMARRLQAAADIELVEMARLAATAEGRPGDTIEQLIAGGLLPSEFGPLPDGSRVQIRDGKVTNSRRGVRGAFVPASDVPVDQVTPSEAATYNKFAEFYAAEWGHMDPIIAGIQRKALANNREHVVVDVVASPFAPKHFDKLRKWLGLADSQQLAPVPGDMAAIDLVLKDQRLFAGLRDVGAPTADGAMGIFPIGRIRDFIVGYVGTTGELGILKYLNLGIPPGSDPAGYAMSPFGGWRRQMGEFTVFSFQRDVLDEVVPQLHFEAAKRPAQVRLRVDDVSNARITPALNDLAYARTRETSLSNVRFLNALNQQLHVPMADCLKKAENLLDATMKCPLGGQYVLREVAGGPTYWTSAALDLAQPSGFMKVHAPPGYVSPPLNWFRGLDLDATMTEKTVTAHAEVIMQMPGK